MGTSLTKRRAAYALKLEESVRRLVQVLSELPGVQKVILFGSYPRGKRDLLTDLDILVIMHTKLGFLERIKFLYRVLGLPVDADILCYTPEEIAAERDRPFLREILRGGVVLYEKKST